jgi:hypothetical protein
MALGSAHTLPQAPHQRGSFMRSKSSSTPPSQSLSLPSQVSGSGSLGPMQVRPPGRHTHDPKAQAAWHTPAATSQPDMPSGKQRVPARGSDSSISPSQSLSLPSQSSSLEGVHSYSQPLRALWSRSTHPWAQAPMPHTLRVHRAAACS